MKIYTELMYLEALKLFSHPHWDVSDHGGDDDDDDDDDSIVWCRFMHSWVYIFLIRREFGQLCVSMLLIPRNDGLRNFQNSSKGLNSTDNRQQLAGWMKSRITRERCDFRCFQVLNSSTRKIWVIAWKWPHSRDWSIMSTWGTYYLPCCCFAVCP